MYNVIYKIQGVMFYIMVCPSMAREGGDTKTEGVSCKIPVLTIPLRLL